MKRFLVRITESYESFAVVEAEDASAAEELAEDMADSGDIDGVNMKGVLKSGGCERYFDCMGPSELEPTATKSPRRKHES